MGPDALLVLLYMRAVGRASGDGSWADLAQFLE